MSEWRRKVYGDDYMNREETFDKKMSEIEEKYAYWFAERINEVSGEKPDRLHNYWISSFNGTVTTFSVKADTDLPKIISDECLLAFKESFSNKLS